MEPGKARGKWKKNHAHRRRNNVHTNYGDAKENTARTFLIVGNRIPWCDARSVFIKAFPTTSALLRKWRHGDKLEEHTVINPQHDPSIEGGSPTRFVHVI